MADYYCDWSHTNNGDGDGWSDAVGAGGAFNSLASAASAASGGDTVWVRGVKTGAGDINIVFSTAPGNPIIVQGVKAATTATPPTASDLIPGLRTGDATRAYDQTAGNAPPSFTQSSGALDISGDFYAYGLVLNPNTDYTAQGGDMHFEECAYQISQRAGGSDSFHVGTGSNQKSYVKYTNCKLDLSKNTGLHIEIQTRGGRGEFFGLEVVGTPTTLLKSPTSQGNGVRVLFEACDLSTVAGTLVSLAGDDYEVEFLNCKRHASSTLASGTKNGRLQIKSIQSSSATTTSGNSEQNLEIEDFSGSINEETTAVRTGGASDGATGSFAWALQPDIDDTRDNYLSLISPWMTGWIAGDGSTAKTFTCYIANSGAGDYQDDEVWLEIFTPSAAGSAQHDHDTTQMNLLGTAANITDDAVSTWGTGASNGQKLSVTATPDFEGPFMARVHFAKNFGATPETLYVDPLIEVT